jgi:hypothetical protein
MSETTKTADDKIQELDDKLIADREKWSNRILELIRGIKAVDQLADSQVSMLSYRHMLVDHITEIQGLIYKKKASYEVKYKEKYIEYSTTGNLKLNGGEKDRFVKADLMPVQRQISLLESHLDFYRECIRTLDNSAFAIRNRIKLAEDDF